MVNCTLILKKCLSMIKSYVTINRCVKLLLNNETNHENMLQSHCKRSRKIKKSLAII